MMHLYRYGLANCGLLKFYLSNVLCLCILSFLLICLVFVVCICASIPLQAVTLYRVSVKHNVWLVSNYFAFQKKVLSIYYKLVCCFLLTKILCGHEVKTLLPEIYFISICNAIIWKVIEILKTSFKVD